MPDDEISFMHPRHVQTINRSPLQKPGQDRIVRKTVTGGPDVAGDRRLYASAKLLARLLEVARASQTRRAVLPRVGVQIELREAADGHRYEVWTLVSGEPRAESPTLLGGGD